MKKSLSLFTLLFTVFVSLPSLGQVDTGFPTLGSFSNAGSGPGSIDLANLNIHFSIPIRSLHAGGLNTAVSVEMDSSAIWCTGPTLPVPACPAGSTQWPTFLVSPMVVSTNDFVYVPETVAPAHNCPGGFNFWTAQGTVLDPHGTYHKTGPLTVFCGNTGTSTPGPDGWSIKAKVDTQGFVTKTGIDSSGIEYTQDPYTDNLIVSDPHNNTSTLNYFSNRLTDPSGALVGVVQPSGPNIAYVQYTDGNGDTTQKINFTYASFNENGYFGCPGTTDNNPNGTPVTLLTGISFPDGSSYAFTYEPNFSHSNQTTGRIATVTLPTGGKITYDYTGYGTHGENCALKNTAGFTETSSVDAGAGWKFDNSTGTGVNHVVKVTDPSGNTSTYTFDYLYQTQMVNKDSGGATLQTVTTCYNGVYSNCVGNSSFSASSSLPTQVDTYTDIGAKLGLTVGETVYDSYHRVTSSKLYDFGAVALGNSPGSNYLRKTTLTYGTCGTTILTKVCSTTVVNTGNSTLSTITNGYNAAGDLTQTVTKVGGTSADLVSSASYNSNGTLLSTTDVNNNMTNYTQGDCAGFFPTVISTLGGTIKTTLSWDCVGEVVKSITDPSGQINGTNVSMTYGDPLYRVKSVTDQLLNPTAFTYSPTGVGTTLNFNNGISTNSVGDTVDGMGRLSITQKRQSQSSSTYDTVSRVFDTNGRLSTTSIPCSVAAFATCPTVQHTQTYDGLSRPYVLSDAGGGTLTTTYPGRDVLVVMGPAPSGENVKNRQYEYDALGRLLSVCEITSTTGSGPCGQDNGGTGFKTLYAYDTVANHSLVVTQGTQTRTYLYDNLGRLTSETNPESGTTTYVYDASSIWTSHGDLVQKTDANNIATYFNYDGLHRLTDEGNYVNGAWVSGSCRRFRYDNSQGVAGSIPASVTISNAMGNMVEAETDSCNPYPPTAPITDEWFSYSARGELTDVYELTPHSGGVYYHTTAAYAANGALASLSGIPGYTAITYGFDGEGRLSTAVQGTSKIVCDSSCSSASTTYYPGGQPHVVTIGGTTDGDNYTYDSMGRMTNYTFTVGSTPTSITGGLTWNPNGTLNKLQISDGFNAGGTQNCNYGTTSTPGYDDLGRLLNVNCGSPWSQAFSYDRFGNISKTGSLSWACATCYNGNNQYNTTLSSLISYDNDGNLLKDTFHTYTWDAYAHVSTIDSTACGTNGTCLTYDALGRLVEKSVNANYTETVYSPVGRVALMTGQTTSSAFFPLPAGESVYETGATGTGKHFQHKDWLGTARFASQVTNRVLYYDLAYAPFGEAYDKFGTNAGNIFAGQTEDTISGTYDTPNRELNPSQGRWLSPDPAGLSAVDLTNPQSWNRYAYVLNNPLNESDLSGLCDDNNSSDCSNPPAPQCGSEPGELDCGGAPINPNAEIPLIYHPPVSKDSWSDAIWSQIGQAGYYNQNIFGPGGFGARPGETAVPPNNISWALSFTKSFFAANNGFTLGIRAPGQTFTGCMQTNAGNYSLLGVADFAFNANGQIANNFWLGFTPASNTITNTYNAVTGSLTSLLQAGPGVVAAGMGTVLTSGRRTSSIMSLNLPGTPGGPKGGFPALGPAPSNAAQAAKAAGAALKLAVDAGFFLAEGFGCLIHR
jgi:RHS repeat-associated protein